MKQSPYTQLERLPANEQTLSQLEQMYHSILEKERRTKAVDAVEFVTIKPVWRDHWIPPEVE
jgi:hypothetical protein